MQKFKKWSVSFLLVVSGCVALLIPTLSQKVSAVSCLHRSVFATDGSGNLYRYDLTGTQVGSTVTLATTYYDVAIDSNNGTFYGIRSNGQVDVVNISNGTVIRSFSARAGFYNSLTSLPTGMLAAVNGSSIVYIDPRTGSTTDYFDMNLIQDENGQTYSGWGSAGDFITLSDGSLIALLVNGSVPVTTSGTIVVKITSGQGQILGTVQSSWGGARVGSDLIIATSNGQLRKVTSLPTSAGRGAISTSLMASLGSGGYYGATGTEDSALSNCSTISQNNVTPGTDSFTASSPQTPATAGAAVVVVATTIPTTATTVPTVATTIVPETTTTVQSGVSGTSAEMTPKANLPDTGTAETLSTLVALSMIAVGVVLGIRQRKHADE